MVVIGFKLVLRHLRTKMVPVIVSELEIDCTDLNDDITNSYNKTTNKHHIVNISSVKKTSHLIQHRNAIRSSF